MKLFNKEKFEMFNILMVTEYFINTYDEPTVRTRYYAVMPHQEREIKNAYKNKERVSLNLEDNTIYGLDFKYAVNYAIIPVYNMEDVSKLINQPGISEKNKFDVYGISNQLVKSLKKDEGK